MNSRERVLSAIDHRTPDRIPIDLGGTRQSGIAVEAYEQLKESLSIQSLTRVFDLYQMLAEVERPVRERLGADVMGLYRPAVAFGIENSDWKPWTTFNGTRVEVPGSFEPVTEPSGDLVIIRDNTPIARMPVGGFYFDRLEVYPGAAHIDIDQFEPPRISTVDLEHYRLQAEALDRNTDFAIVAPLGPPFELFYGMGTGDFESWMITLATEPDYVMALYEKLTEVWIDNLKQFYSAVGDKIQVLQICDDFGTQAAPFVSPAMFRRLIMPFYQRGISWIHEHTPWKVLLHSDGALVPLMPSLIEMGIDVLNPVQTSAAGMNASQLKREYGDQIAFWGGSLDCQHTLPYGTVEEVRAEVERHLQTFAPGGGFIFAPVHNIQAGVPPENILAMFDVAKIFVASEISPTPRAVPQSNL